VSRFHRDFKLRSESTLSTADVGANYQRMKNEVKRRDLLARIIANRPESRGDDQERK